MDKFKLLTVVAVTAVIGTGIFYACQKDQLTENISRYRKSNDTYEEFRQYMCEGLITFKESLRPYYEQVGNYNEFCDLLNVNQSNITPIGNGLLRLGYECLEKEYSDEYIREYYTGKWMAQGIDPIVILYTLSTWDLFGIDNYDHDNPLGEHCYLMLREVRDKINNAGIMELLQGFCGWTLNGELFMDQSLPVISVEETIQNDIIYFQERYSIDIVGDVIHNDNYRQVVDALNDFSSELYGNLSSMNSGQLSAFVNELTPLVQWQSHYYNTGEYEQFLERSEEIYRLAFPWMPENEFVYEETGRTFSLPTNYLSEMQERLVSSQQVLFSSYPQCNDMNENDYALFLQTAFLASDVYGGYTMEFPPAYLPDQPNTKLNDCLNSAKTSMGIDLAVASSAYLSSTIGCAFLVHPLAIGLCFVAAKALYGYSVYSTVKSYNTSVENCNLKHGK